MGDLPKKIIRTSTQSLVEGKFIVWAVALFSQAIFIICMVIIWRRDFQQQIQSYQTESSEPPSEIQETPRAASVRGNEYPRKASIESKSLPSLGGRSRAGSDTMPSLRASVSQVVHPLTPKTKLTSKSQHGPTSIESSTWDTSISVEDGFDSWDTSTVDAQSRQAVESASPTPPRFLETIPASPATSRSPSPGFPLDQEPPKQRKRSRSYSPEKKRSRSSKINDDQPD